MHVLESGVDFTLNRWWVPWQYGTQGGGSVLAPAQELQVSEPSPGPDPKQAEGAWLRITL